MYMKNLISIIMYDNIAILFLDPTSVSIMHGQSFYLNHVCMCMYMIAHTSVLHMRFL